MHNYWMTNYPVPCDGDGFNSFTGFGAADAAQQAKDDAVATFNQASVQVSQRVQTAYARLLASGADPALTSTMANMLGTLNAIADQVRTGDINQVTQYNKVANTLVTQMNDLSGGSCWDNWPDLSSWLQQILEIPAMLEKALLAVANAAGKTIHEVAAGVGVDSGNLPGEIDSAITKVVLGLVVVGVAYAFFKTRK